MEMHSIGNESFFLSYCRKRKVTVHAFPKELEHEDRKNKGYHFVYEQDLFAWAKSLPLKVPYMAIFGSGDYHYITHALLRNVVDNIYDGYSVILIDNHDDCEDIRAASDTGKYPLNCATHMRESLKKSKLLEVIHISKKSTPAADWYDRNLQKRSFSQITGEEVPTLISEEFIQTILDSIFDKVYLSIDIDALSPDDVDIEQYQAYDQGTMRLQELLMILEKTLQQKNVIGIDICGMSQDPRAEQVYDAIIATVRKYQSLT